MVFIGNYFFFEYNKVVIDMNYIKIIITILYLIIFIKGDEMFFYKKINVIKNPDNLLVLVNKNNCLSKNYIPNDLVVLETNYSKENKIVRKLVKDNIISLIDDASDLGYYLNVTSGYRNFDYQNSLFEYYSNEYSLNYALNSSAKPGHSEHQTGLAIDIEGSNFDYDDFENAKEFNWMINNCHKYGFILRYPLGKEHITGFKYEPWHYRYVGIDVATYIMENNITLEEYYFFK